MSNRKVYIYSITDPRDDKVFYIGQTINLEKRKVGHRHDSLGYLRWIRINEIFNSKLEPIYNILEECTESDKFKRESFWIMKFLNDGFELLNQECKFYKRDQLNKINQNGS